MMFMLDIQPILHKEKKMHKSNCNNINGKSYNYKIYKTIRANLGWDNWIMEVIEKYPCDNVYNACGRERYWIETLSSNLNVIIPYRSKKEYQQIYNLIHKNEIAEKAKLYRNNKFI